MIAKNVPGNLFRRRPGGNWIYAVWIAGKVRHRTTQTKNKNEAIEISKKIYQTFQLQKNISGRLLKFSQASTTEIERIENEVSLLQAERVSNSFHQFLKWLGEDIQISKIDTNMLSTYQRHRFQIVSRDTLDKDTNFILRMLKNNDIHIQRPRARAGKKTEIRPFTKDELIKFFNHCDNSILRCLFLTMLSTGARPTELIPSKRSTHIQLLKEEVDLNRGEVTIRSAKVLPGHQGKVRKIRISYELIKLLRHQIESNQGDYVFPHIFISREFNRILKLAGVQQIDNLGRKLIAHSFRHTYASFIAEETGGDQFVLKTLLGHTKIITTERYVHTRTKGKIYDIDYLQKNRKERTQNEEK